MEPALPHLADPARPAPNDGAPSGTGMALRQRSVCLCADDFGLHEGINAAVLALAQQRHLGAVACMVDGPCWVEGAAPLRALPAQWLDVGLHLDLTEVRFSHHQQHPPRKYPRRRLIATSYLRRLNADELAAEITRQLDQFERHMQRPPAFVSGHRHVHQLPQVRDALLHVLLQRYPSYPRPWLRHTQPALQGRHALRAGLRNAIKAQAIAWLGAQALAQAAAAHGLAMNRALAGVYGFDASARVYQRLFAIWLQHCQHGDVLVCHPSNSVVPSDAIAHARCIEYQVLAADNFEQLLTQAEVHIGPLSRCLPLDGPHTPHGG